MKNKITVSKGLIIIQCLNAVLWIANLLIYLTEEEIEPKLLLFKVVCAVLWSFATLLSLLGYRKEKKNTTE